MTRKHLETSAAGLLLLTSLLLSPLSSSAANGAAAVATAGSVKAEKKLPDDFCSNEADGEYENPVSCRSSVICEKFAIKEVKPCPKGQVINPYKPTFPRACEPIEKTDLREDCSRKPPTKPVSAPPQPSS